MLAYVDSAPRPAVRVLISALGDLARAEEALHSAAAAVLAAGQQPVFVATGLSTAFLVAETVPVEILPRRTDLRAMSDSEYAGYLRRRWTLILAKWGVAEEIALGLEFEDFLAGQLSA